MRAPVVSLGRRHRGSPLCRDWLDSSFPLVDTERRLVVLSCVGRAVLEELGFSGVVKLDFKRDSRDDRLYLLEINPRFNLWHHPGAVAGVSIPALVYRDCVEPGTAQPAGAVRPGVRWVSLREDAYASREYRAAGELSFARWLLEMATADVNEGFLLRDPLPGLADVAGTFRRKLARLLSRRPMRPRPQTP